MRFTWNFGPISNWNFGPISNCIKKKNPRKWDKECSEALEELKRKICSIHTLGVPPLNESHDANRWGSSKVGILSW